MSRSSERQIQIDLVLKGIVIPSGIHIRAWKAADFPAVQRLSMAEGWPTPTNRPDEALMAWQTSWPTLVVAYQAEVIGFVRALTDEHITMYIAELLIAPQWRGHQLGKILLDVCHQLYPSTRLDLLSTQSAEGFYESIGFRPFQGFRKSYR